LLDLWLVADAKFCRWRPNHTSTTSSWQEDVTDIFDQEAAFLIQLEVCGTL